MLLFHSYHDTDEGATVVQIIMQIVIFVLLLLLLSIADVASTPRALIAMAYLRVAVRNVSTGTSTLTQE